MQARFSTLCTVLVFVTAGTAFADFPSAVYVTTGRGRQVLKIDIDAVSGVQTGPAQTLATAASDLTDLTQRSDGAIVYATATEIRQVGQAAPVAAVSGAQELRFSAYNCLFYNSAGGAASIGCGSGAPSGGGGRGLAFSAFGHLLALSGNTVVRIPLDAQGNRGAAVPLVSAGLTSPSGIAVANGLGVSGLARGDFAVADGRFVRLFDKTGALKHAAYAAVPSGQQINFIEFDADDRLWIAAMTESGAAWSANGRIYRADAAGAVCAGSGCVLAATLPGSQNNFWPAMGLALAPSSRLLTRAIAPIVPNVEQTFTFDFGNSIVEVSGVVIAACELRVRSSTVPAPAAVSLINDSQYSLNPYLGEEGFPTVYHIHSLQNGVEVDADACVEVSGTNKVSVFIAALTSTEINPRILRCDAGCSETELFAWWHTGPIEGDAGGVGRDLDWSDWLIVEKAVAPAGSQVDFCGVGPPLRTDRIEAFNSGSNLTVKAQFSAPGYACASRMFLTDPNATFLISLAQVAPVYNARRVISASGNSGVPPTLTQAGKFYEFELSLKNPDGTNYPAGRYEITITDVTPGGTRLNSPAIVYFDVK